MKNESQISLIQVKGIPTHGGKYNRYKILGNLFVIPSTYAPPVTLDVRGALFGKLLIITYRSNWNTCFSF